MTTQIGQAPHSELFFDSGDKVGEAQFILWHHLRHHTYDLILSQRGTTLPPLDLTTKVDGDWLQRHSIRHSTLRKIAGTVTDNSTVGLKVLRWDDPKEQQDWLRIHAIDHANLDAYFGLT